MSEEVEAMNRMWKGFTKSKEEVCNIQKSPLIKENCIAFIGTMGVGKTTCLSLLEKELKGTTRLKFASKIYEIQDLIYKACNLKMQGEKDRKLLQWLGTEWGRSIDQNLWLNIFKSEFDSQTNSGKLILSDDCRFKNEYELLKDNKTLFVRVQGTPKGDSISNEKHSSERDVRDMECDYVINNTGSLDDLKNEISTLAVFLKCL